MLERETLSYPERGRPQEGVRSPLLCIIFLHQLDEYVMKDLQANQTQTKRESNSRRNPEYRKIEGKIARLRRQLKQTQGPARAAIIRELTELERQERDTPYYAKEARHPSTIGYVRHAADFVILIQGRKAEAQVIKDDIGKRLGAQ